MASEDIIKKQISDIEKLISEIDDNLDDSEYFCTLSQRIQHLTDDINRIHSGYYVAFINIGPEDNFSRFYYPLGFMTTYEAYRILRDELTIYRDPCNEEGIVEVSKEEYDKYYSLITLDELHDHIVKHKNELIAVLPPNFIKDIKVKIDKLRSDLGFTYSWQYVCRRQKYK